MVFFHCTLYGKDELVVNIVGTLLTSTAWIWVVGKLAGGLGKLGTSWQGFNDTRFKIMV